MLQSMLGETLEKLGKNPTKSDEKLFILCEIEIETNLIKIVRIMRS